MEFVLTQLNLFSLWSGPISLAGYFLIGLLCPYLLFPGVWQTVVKDRQCML